jgi:hypothetical protein
VAEAAAALAQAPAPSRAQAVPASHWQCAESNKP